MVRTRGRAVHGLFFVYFYHCSARYSLAKIITTLHFSFAVTCVVWFYTVYHNVIWSVLGWNIFHKFGLVFPLFWAKFLNIKLIFLCFELIKSSPTSLSVWNVSSFVCKYIYIYIWAWCDLYGFLNTTVLHCALFSPPPMVRCGYPIL